MRDIKPCPFCGGTEVVCTQMDDSSWFVECRTCYATGPMGVSRAEAIGRWDLQLTVGGRAVAAVVAEN
jgi:Lar family restriction alleviation protein